MACQQILLFLVCFFGAFFFFITPEEEIHWDWSKITLDSDKLSQGFSKEFVWFEFF
jgi:hypothetical protein